MTTLRSRIKTGSDEFKANAVAMEQLVADLNARLERAREGGSEEHRQRHLQRGKLLVRERIRHHPHAGCILVRGMWP